MERSVLIIDDDEKLLRLLKQYLEQMGFSVVTETNPFTALQRLVERRLDIVVTDLMMPQLNGLDVCERIKSFSSIPVIVMSARNDIETHRLVLMKGSNLFLPKPFSPQTLAERIRSALP